MNSFDRSLILFYFFFNIWGLSRFFRAGKVYYCYAIALLMSRPMILPEGLVGHILQHSKEKKQDDTLLYLHVNTLMHLSLYMKMSGK